MNKKVAKLNKIDPRDTDKQNSIVQTIGFLGLSFDSNAVQVGTKDGKILRISPLHYDLRYNTDEIRPWRIEARGKIFDPSPKSLISPLSLAYKNRVYSPNRILYPLKRVDWDPQGERHTENRGKSEYVRISWDEALNIVTSELRRVKEKYGPSAVLSQTDGHGESKMVHNAHGCSTRLLQLLGGYTQQARNADSWEGWYWGAKHVWGMDPVGQMLPQSNLFPDIAENTEMLLFWGCDPETTPWGFNGQMASRLCYWFKDLNIKSVYICPDLNYGAAIHASKWIPVLPNTDAALQLAIIYTWIKEGTYDKDYVKTHVVGMDKMADYVLGKEDGVAKTPEWASKKCGVPEWTIKALARQFAAKRTSITHGNGGSLIRGPYSHEPGRLEVVLLGMQGVGKPGCHQVKMLEWGLFGNPHSFITLGNPPLPRPIMYPDLMEANRGWKIDPKAQPVNNQFIPKDLIHDALNLEKGTMSWYGKTLARTSAEDQFIKYTYPAPGYSEIHMIWTDSPCWITCWNDSNSYIKGLRSPKIEFILAQHPWLENDCQFADVILPSNTKFEVNDISVDSMNGNVTAMVYNQKCVEPRGESKSDYEIVCAIAEKMGLMDEYTGRKTAEEWIKHGLETSGLQDKISFAEFKKKGYYVIPTDPDWKKYPVGISEFYEDPEKKPLKTPTGKLEFYSERLDKNFPGDKERPPVPHWIENSETHQERTSSTRAKEYPLLVVSNHGRWRVHAQHDDMMWLREIETCKMRGPDGYMYQPVWINPADALKRRIRHGDIVKIFNERGGILAAAYVTERMIAGAISIDHGARYDPIIPGELDRGGAINTISPHNTSSKNATGMASSGYLAEVKPADLNELKRKYPKAFNKPYQAASGLILERLVKPNKGVNS
jgi:molybdopterin guanine dinucleotide-containing S/N-oxide reductase-like protein